MRTFFVLLMVAGGAFAGESTDIVVGQRFTLDSKIMGEQHTVLVHLPANYENGADRYPVLYMTDGDGHVLHTGGTVSFLARNQRMPNMIVVGVTNTNRTRDLTPESAEERWSTQGGGANRFLKFFTDELVPYIEANYRTHPYRVFAGHSFGGLFAVNAFLQQPDAFNAYLAVSPSLWWNGESMVADAKAFFAKHKELNSSLYITLGDEGERMEGPLNHFTEVLKGQNTVGFEWETRLFPDEDHGSVVLRSHYFGLKKIFDGWQPTFQEPDLDKLVAHFEKLTKRMGYELQPPEATVNMMGYRLVGDDVKAAIRVFEWNAKKYPESPNVYDSLGEAQEKAGMLDQALKNYKTAYKKAKNVNHNNTGIYKENMERVLKELSKKTS